MINYYILFLSKYINVGSFFFGGKNNDASINQNR